MDNKLTGLDARLRTASSRLFYVTHMNNIAYQFEVMTPELPDALAPEPQTLVFALDIHTVKVFVYFMLNSALSITGGQASSAMGTVELSLTVDSPSGVVCASVNLRKVCFTFTEAQGMARSFRFIHPDRSTTNK